LDDGLSNRTFSADSLANRIMLSKAKVLITADGYYRGNKAIPLKSTSDQAVSICAKEGHRVHSVIMLEHLKRVKRPDGVDPPEVNFNEDIDIKWETAMANVKNKPSPVEWTSAEDPLLLIFTS
jgi:acetyl-CoA synthetase